MNHHTLAQFRLSDYINHLAWSPEGTWLAVSLAAGEVVVLDPETKTVLTRYPAHAMGCLQVAWVSQEVLASAGQDGKVRLHNVFTSEDVAVIEVVQGRNVWVEQLAFGHGMLAATAGKTLCVWDDQGRQLYHADDFPSTVQAIEWVRDQPRLITACYGGVYFYTFAPDVSVEILPYPISFVSLAHSPNGKFLAAGTQDKALHFWHLPYVPKQDLQMSGYYAKIRQLEWNRSGEYLATPSYDKLIVWDLHRHASPRGTRPVILEGHEHKVTRIRFQADGPFLATGDEGGTALIWDFPYSEEILFEVQFVGAQITEMAWCPQRDLLAIGTDQGQIRLIGIEMDPRIRQRLMGL